MEMYKMLHASEKPSDLRKISIPFQNTSELQEIRKDLIFQLGDRKQTFQEKKKNTSVQDKLKNYYKDSQMLGHLFEGKHFAVIPNFQLIKENKTGNQRRDLVSVGVQQGLGDRLSVQKIP